MRRIKDLWHRHHSLAFQFGRYLFSGGSAAALELLSYKCMLLLSVWYLLAAPLSSGIGILAAFLLNKYLVFKKRDSTTKHAIRYTILTVWNVLVQTGIVYVLVEFAGTGPTIAKVLGIGCTVSWNFFLYKYIVYV